MNNEKLDIDLFYFTGRKIPITEITRAMQKNARYIRVGLRQGMLKIGYSLKADSFNVYDYYYPNRKILEEISYFRSGAA